MNYRYQIQETLNFYKQNVFVHVLDNNLMSNLYVTRVTQVAYCNWSSTVVQHASSYNNFILSTSPWKVKTSCYHFWCEASLCLDISESWNSWLYHPWYSRAGSIKPYCEIVSNPWKSSVLYIWDNLNACTSWFNLFAMQNHHDRLSISGFVLKGAFQNRKSGRFCLVD